MLLGGLLGFLEFLLKFVKFLGQISHLSRVTTALLPGLLRGIKELIGLTYLFAVLVKPAKLTGVVCLEGFAWHHLQCLAEHAFFLGAGPPEPPPLPSFLGILAPFLGAVPAEALMVLAFSPSFAAKTFSMFSRSRSIDLVDSGTVL
jgi:hypothetical protein